MKNKIIYFVFMFVLSASFAFSQSSDVNRTSFAILGGVNMQNFTGKNFTGGNLENDIKLGYHIGVNAQIPIAPEIYFQPGLLFSTKGAKNTNEGINSTYSLSYIEVPLNVVYKAGLGNGFVMLGFGPYLGYGIKGRTSIQGGDAGDVESDVVFKNVVDVNDPLASTYFRPFDAGGNVFAGYEMSNGVFLQLNTQFGLLKINPDDQRFPNGELSTRNTGFSFSLGYRF